MGSSEDSQVKRFNFCVILTDIRMPIMNGFELCEKVHEFYDEQKANMCQNHVPLVELNPKKNIDNVQNFNYSSQEIRTKPPPHEFGLDALNKERNSSRSLKQNMPVGRLSKCLVIRDQENNENERPTKSELKQLKLELMRPLLIATTSNLDAHTR